jgi:hypothetical protein
MSTIVVNIIATWILLWTNPCLLFYLPECLRVWLDYPGHSILFSRPLMAYLELTGGLSRHYSCGHPIGISLQVRPWRHLTPDWHFSSRPLVASLEFTGGPATTLVDTRLAFLFKTYRGVTWHPTGISFILFSLNFPCLPLTFPYIHLFAYANMLSCHDLIPVSMHLI